jgi:hypothetical protein
MHAISRTAKFLAPHVKPLMLRAIAGMCNVSVRSRRHDAMTHERHLCPVCHRPVTRTQHHNIGGHYDKNHNICPGSYQNFDITIQEATT